MTGTLHHAPTGDAVGARMSRFLWAGGVALAGLLAVLLLITRTVDRLSAAVGVDLNAAEELKTTDALTSALHVFAFIAGVGQQAGWTLLPGIVGFLLIRRLPRRAAFAATAGAGGVILGVVQPFLAAGLDGAKLPFFDDVLGLTVVLGVALLVFFPVLSGPARRWLVGGAAILVVGFGVLGVAAGSGSLVAVAGGWALGILWLVLIVIAYRRWGAGRVAGPLSADEEARLRPAPAGDPVIPRGRRGGAVLAGVAAVLIGALLALGLLVILPSRWVQQFDGGVTSWFVGIRGDLLSFGAAVFDALGNTPGIVAVLLAALPLSLAITRRRDPAIFLVVAAVGQNLIFVIVSLIVNRPRPDVDHLWMELPATSGYPSGHVAATVATYGGIALLVVAWARGPWRYASIAVAAGLVVAVASARLYWGMHNLTDTATSAVYSAVWLAACWALFRPVRDAGARAAPLGASRRGLERYPDR